MVQFTPLDNVYPATWDGTPTPDAGTNEDPATRVRFTVGDDWNSYFLHQRFQGDLFKRDLLNQSALESLINWLSTRGGISYATPVVKLLPGAELVLGRVNVPNTRAAQSWCVFAQISEVTLYTVAASELTLKVVPTAGGAALWEVNAGTTAADAWAAALASSRGGVMAAGTSYTVKLVNANSTCSVDAAACFVWRPSQL